MPSKRDRRQQPRSVWDANHPIWAVLKGLVAFLLILVAGDHFALVGHHGGVDSSDVAGVGGMAIAGRLAWQFFKG